MPRDFLPLLLSPDGEIGLLKIKRLYDRSPAGLQSRFNRVWPCDRRRAPSCGDEPSWLDRIATVDEVTQVMEVFAGPLGACVSPVYP
jgi:hypothetical protein